LEYMYSTRPLSSVSTDPLLVDVTLICPGAAEAEPEGEVEPAEAEDDLGVATAGSHREKRGTERRGLYQRVLFMISPPATRGPLVAVVR
jgi:hypothetical protein